MQVFSKRRFGIVLHTFIPCTAKILHMHLAIFQRIWDIISYNMSENVITKDYHFLCLLWSVIFPRSTVESIVTKIFDDCFSLVWSWIDARELSQLLLFFLLILVVKLPFMFVLTILLPLALLPIILLSFCPFSSGLSKSIFFLRFLTKIWFPLLREVLWEWCCKFAYNDSMIDYLSLSCIYMFFQSSNQFRIIVWVFLFLISCKISETSVLQDPPFVTIVSRYSKMLTDSEVDSSLKQSFWSRYIYI